MNFSNSMKNSQRQPTVCIVIPCHRTALRPFEQLALEQCRSVLGAYDTFFIKPASLNLDQLSDRYQINSESFDDRFFESVASYNELMLLDEFYSRFSSYDYMLIYQLDAFVFRDELLDWCKKGHDYIGAPWLPNSVTPRRLDDIYIKARQYYFRWINKIDSAAKGIHGAQYMYAVGNGGFSLRRISRMRSVLKALPSIADQYRRRDGNFHHEDIFFSVEANRYLPRVKVPGFREAAGFAWERQPTVARDLNKGRLPFGCHGWNKLHLNEWRPIFSSLGHSIDELVH